MKTLTRVLCLVLCLMMLAPTLVACGAKELTYGPQINMYLSSEVYNFDPAYAYLDVSAAKVLGLMYEGLFTIDNKGNLEKIAEIDFDSLVKSINDITSFINNIFGGSGIIGA